VKEPGAIMKKRAVRETVGGEVYEYVPLGQHVVSAPRVCRGRPTFKYTRIEVAGILDWLGAGRSLKKLIANSEGRLSLEAIQEAARLAGKALVRQTGKAIGG